ncbi:MAG: phosphoglycerate kinase [Oscillospiraceae bacterium]|nr:phosphoglycerate kinase [Oscillospiraceae bacterium]
MNYSKKTINDVDVKGKKVLLRCDFNVPQDKATGAITSDKRIVAALHTIRYLLENGAAVIACSHLGKPKGEIKPNLSLKVVAERLAELLGKEVVFAADTIGPDAQAKAAALQPGQILLLENLRFDKREEKNDPEFAKALAELAGKGGVYVSDAFGTVHRAHASTAGVAAYLPAVSGLLIQKELEIMGKALDDPKRPFVAVLGGAKVSDKIAVINNLLDKANTIIIGGGMAYTFLKAQGHSIGKSLLEADRLDYANDMVVKAAEKGVTLLLPVDHLCASDFSADADCVPAEGQDIPEGLMGMDIGPKTAEIYAAAIRNAGTVVWNGPMGVFEFDKFAGGTRAMAKALAESGAVTIVGGGASLEFLEGKELPGVACLLDK